MASTSKKYLRLSRAKSYAPQCLCSSICSPRVYLGNNKTMISGIGGRASQSVSRRCSAVSCDVKCESDISLRGHKLHSVRTAWKCAAKYKIQHAFGTHNYLEWLRRAPPLRICMLTTLRAFDQPTAANHRHLSRTRSVRAHNEPAHGPQINGHRHLHLRFQASARGAHFLPIEAPQTRSRCSACRSFNWVCNWIQLNSTSRIWIIMRL